MSGLKFIKYNRPKLACYVSLMKSGPAIVAGLKDIGPGTCVQESPLTTAHTITAIETLIAGSATDGNMSAGIAGRRIALHAFGSGIDGVYTYFCFFNSGFYRF